MGVFFNKQLSQIRVVFLDNLNMHFGGGGGGGWNLVTVVTILGGGV